MAENQNAGVVEMSRNFSVPVERLFEAWNEPGQLKQWWHPLNNHLENVKNDLREGGEIEYEFEDHKLHITGNYKEVNKNEKLVYTWNWELADEHLKNAEYTLSIDFVPEQNGSRLKIRQEGFPDERATHPHREGWEQGLESLQQFLDGESNQSSPMNNAGQPMESPENQLGPYDYPGQEQGTQLKAGQQGSQPNASEQGTQLKAGQQGSQPNASQQGTQNNASQQGHNAGAGTNTSNPTQENFDPAKPENSVSPEY